MKIKNIQEVGSRGILFTYEFGDSVYLINGEEFLFLCDTNEGKDSMKYIKDYIELSHQKDKPLYVFNSHSDWDHFWGNEAFDAPIIAHKSALERMKERALFDLEVLSDFHNGKINLKYPTITFTDRLVFESEGIAFIYAPGHTIDSSICFDMRDEVIYVGDLLEKPIPQINYVHIYEFIESLELIKSLNPKTIITTHSHIVEPSLIDEHIHYLNDLNSGKYLSYTSEQVPIIHQANMKNLLVLKYEERIKEKLKDEYNYALIKKDIWEYIKRRHEFFDKKIWDIRELTYQELEKDLNEYESRISD